MAGSWETLRRQAKQLEQEVESKLSLYAKQSNQNDSTIISIEQANLLPAWNQSESLESEIQDCLRRLTQTTNQMSEFLDTPHTPTNPSQMHVLQRHREILYDYSREFNRTRANLSSARSHEELLSGGSSNRNDNRDGMGMHDMMLNERNHIDGAHSIADQVLEQANITREQLAEQDAMLRRSHGRMGGILNRFPAINNLVQKISTKKKRDQMIVAGVLASKVIVMFKAGTSPEVVEAAAQRLIANGGAIGHRYSTSIIGFAATMPDSLLPSFTDDVSIESIEADGEVSALFKPKN
ncbi:Golgi SNAP receptor complex member 1 [Podochytrium sp. JEL0797]|nr:Golgi SNAP receptor complex member 1 [Podochytrium sp. JEL0797]